jgi:hypothetical protein
MKLDAIKFGLTCGIVWAGGVLCLGLLSSLFNWGTPMVKALGSLYLGYKASPLGISVGTLWAFVDGGVGGLVIALVYNWLLGLGKK